MTPQNQQYKGIIPQRPQCKGTIPQNSRRILRIGLALTTTATTTKDTTTKRPTTGISFETTSHRRRPVALAHTSALIAFELMAFFLEHSMIAPFGKRKISGGVTDWDWDCCAFPKSLQSWPQLCSMTCLPSCCKLFRS